MAGIPAWLLRHTITLERYLGVNAHGEVYGDPAEVPAFVDDSRRLVRDTEGREVTSSATVYAPLNTQAAAGDRVTHNGRTSTVLTVAYRDGAGLPTPDHCEISLE